MLTMRGTSLLRRFYNHRCFMVVSISGLLIYILIGIFMKFQINQQSKPINSNSKQSTLSSTVLQPVLNMNVNQHEKKGSKVIIAAYMRSGSSITARILEENPDTFYVFEPLLTVATMRKYFLTAVYSDQPMQIMRRGDDNMEKILDSFLNCNLHEINLETLAQFHMDKSSSTREFYYCSHTTRASRWRPDCFYPLLGACLSKKYSVIKTIRMKIASLENLLVKDPLIKLVHLIRDPRAVAASQITSWSVKSINQNRIDAEMKQTVTLCRTMLENIRASEILFQKFPNRVRVLVFEKFAYNPIETTKILYDFVGFNFTYKIARFVDSVTRAGSPTPCPLCTSQGSSYHTSQKWRTFFNIEQVRRFDEHCSEVFQRVGFTRFQTQDDLVNFNIMSWQYLNQPEYIV
ncbi:hypothetical protein LOTGIDRAFT_231254 [Lottia gigantea]|uniref:Uncharacterized protein n=1 Tax=Lottia gigantea TaxID=225164 RepID=V4A4W8_LOTGI|nr:hypothetical protein LOTGIDRAFT_231254 [Lottia gigantea]ESO98928.1 hypothetical protein LOTGIDRAFT_231254 [Lottia gigantea]